MSGGDPSGVLLIDARPGNGKFPRGGGHGRPRGGGVSRPIRTLIVGSTERLRHAYRDLLAPAHGFEIVALAAPEEARGLTLRHLPDLLLFALEPLKLSELALLRELEEASPRTHVFFSSLTRRAVESLKPRGGANGRAAAAFASDLVAALRPAERPPEPAAPRVLQVHHASDAGPPGAPDASDQEALSSLTPREREVIRMAAEGLSSTETGRRLGISARTAECHRAHGMRKLGLHRRAELVRFAMTAGLVGRTT